MFRRLVFAAIVMAAPAGAQLPADSAARWIDSIFAPYASPRSPGCAVGVTRNGAVAFAKAYGSSNVKAGAPITADTRFYLASLSKQFTALAVVLLEQDGRLSLDDSVRKWLPELPSFGKPITLRQLLNHTSGMRDYMTLLAVSGWPADGELTEQQFLDLMRRQKNLNFVPGDEFLYTTPGTRVVDRAARVGHRCAIAAERIFKPLGMTAPSSATITAAKRSPIARSGTSRWPADGANAAAAGRGRRRRCTPHHRPVLRDENFSDPRVGAKASQSESRSFNNGQKVRTAWRSRSARCAA